MISRNVIFHENATFKSNLQEKEKPPRTNKFRFEVGNLPGHNSQDSLDETSD